MFSKLGKLGELQISFSRQGLKKIEKKILT